MLEVYHAAAVSTETFNLKIVDGTFPFSLSLSPFAPSSDPLLHLAQNNENWSINTLTRLGEIPGVGERFAKVGGFLSTHITCKKLLWNCVINL